MARATRPYIMCDLDGTLCDIEHRTHHVKGKGRKNWKKFFEAMTEDKLNEAVSEVLRRFHGDYAIVFVSGRPSDYRTETEEWIKKHLHVVSDYTLFMRKEGDFRPDDIVKGEIYDRDIAPTFGTPLFILDDRDKVVHMWRLKGLTCFQVAEGDF